MLLDPRTSLFNLPIKKKKEIAVLGVPFDSTQSVFSGSKTAPMMIRLASNTLDEFSFIFKKDLRELSISDWGDLEVAYGNYEETEKRLFSSLDLINAKGYLFLGGDHSISIMTVKYLKGAIRKYTQLDADADFENEYLGNKYSHDCVLRRIGETLGFDKIALIGFRSASPEELRALEDYGVEAYSIYDVKENEEILRDLFKKTDYLSLDMDVFDPSYAPDVGTPEPFGLDPWTFIRNINHLSPKYADIVEITTNKINSQTAILAATLAREILIRISMRKSL